MRRALLLAALALTGCSTTPPRTEAVQTLPPAFYTAPGMGLAPAEWWKRRLRDPALARLIEAALADSPDLAAALARVEQGRAGLRATEAERRPALNGSAGVTYNRTATEQFGFDTGGGVPGAGGPSIDRERILYRAGVDAGWDPDLFGRLRADRRAAAARLDAAGLEAASVRLTLITDVARNFVAARSAVAREALAVQNVERARDTASVTRSRVQAGLVAGIDEQRAQSLVAETAATTAPIQAERAARIAALTTLTGVAPSEVAQLVGSSPSQPSFDLPAAGIPSDLLVRRPDIAASLARVGAADSETASAIASRFPRLTITSTIGLVASSLAGLFSGDALSIVAGPGIAGPIFDFGRNRAQVQLSRARAAEAVANYRSTVLRAFGEVEASLAAAEARKRQLRALGRLVASSQETARLARIQYRSGLTDFLGVLDSERALLRARDQQISAEAELADSELALFRAIGGDFQG
ncbi:MAG TPA: efflux transporter outer membrane subunit [Allosphingosinicella sp.]|nr:efflux transporter outer membrane subunit [Allosphingosinicella sp.]